MSLPIGVYDFRAMNAFVFTNSGVLTTAASSATVSNCTYSDDIFASTDTFNGAQNIEFVNTPATQAVATGVVFVHGKFRVSSITAGTLASALFGATGVAFSGGGTASLVGIRVEVARVSDFLSNPLCSYFPNGNASGQENARVYALVNVSDGERSLELVCPLNMIDTVRTTLAQRALDSGFESIIINVSTLSNDQVLKRSRKREVEEKKMSRGTPSPVPSDIVPVEMTRSVHLPPATFASLTSALHRIAGRTEVKGV